MGWDAIGGTEGCHAWDRGVRSVGPKDVIGGTKGCDQWDRRTWSVGPRNAISWTEAEGPLPAQMKQPAVLAAQLLLPGRCPGRKPRHDSAGSSGNISFCFSRLLPSTSCTEGEFHPPAAHCSSLTLRHANGASGSAARF